MTRTYGEYEVTLDSKGRIALPAIYKKQLSQEEGMTFMLTKGNDNYLILYTASQWKKVEETLDTLNDYNEEAMELKIMMMSGASPIEADAAGRVVIPKRMIQYAGFKKDIVMLGMSDKMLIWDAVEYEKAIDVNKDRQKALSAKILGSSYSNPIKGV
ncbi:MAG: division/cell wall cluster transcriptional repressor MraZ [Chitinophagaceae bacterium]|nr:MAG: MraZ protein [Bacteroidetes bacterium OLB11]MCC6447820.1 division/cell wall cluster transcriptional repressor MraZ [Chitinophagaceae bacterium]HMN31743.1 division/cell wall cluster transcriptional repressor MraZ [Chitinophagaceae bacterium]